MRRIEKVRANCLALLAASLSWAWTGPVDAQFIEARDRFIAEASAEIDDVIGGGVIGACCVDGACVPDVTQAQCLDNFCGTWRGAGSTCGGTACPLQLGGVCCTDGACATQAQIGGNSACRCGGGTWYPGVNSCAGFVCPGGTPGSCCIDGDCANDLTRAECEVDSCGFWNGAGTDCSTVAFCPFAPGDACCLGDVCTTGLGPDSCECAGGEFMVGAFDCTDLVCTPPTGRCCRGGACSVVTESECDAICGLWSGPGTDCSSGIGGTPPCGLLIFGACCLGDACINGLGQYTCTCEGGEWFPTNSCLGLGNQNDCNTNGIVDFCEDFADCNSNGTPDECDKDCNTNGIPDDCELAAGSADDCNTNGSPDECDVADDCDGNGIPDECELVADCAANEPIDCNFDGVTNACEPDCNTSGESDVCELAFGQVVDCTGAEGFIGDFFIGQDIHNDNCAFCHGNGGFGQGGFPNHRNRSRYEYQRKTTLCQQAIGHGGGAFGFPLEDYAHLERYLSDYGPTVSGDGVPDVCQGFADCDGDGVVDECALAGGTEKDCNFNGIPDNCDIAAGVGTDCNSNGIIDGCEIDGGTAADCNGNTLPDTCDVAAGTSEDCNMNLVPDECEPDCNTNGLPDDCEGLPDCDDDGVPDECDPDCNTNGISDVCDILEGTPDCDTNGVPDDCQPDCNGNQVADTCDIASGTSLDLNENGIPDDCEADCNANGIPDDLDVVPYYLGPPRFVAAQLPPEGVVIPDCPETADPQIEVELNVDLGADCGPIDRLLVGLDVTHTWAADLLVELVSPQGTTVTLLSRITLDELDPYCTAGECCGDDLQDVIVTLGDHYDQCVETQTPSRGGVRPFAGATLSPADLATFTGEEACGVWTLRLHDGAEYDEGALLDWTLDFRNAPVSNDCNNNVIPDECELAAGTADDADGNGIPDECFMLRDCNSNGINDEVELELSVTGDCNDNRILDVCELNGLGGLAVAGIGSDIVAEFDPDTGRYLGELVSNDDPCAVYLDLPTNLVFAPDGDLLVCDIADSRVLAFDGLSGAFHGEFVAEDAGGLISPIDLDFAPDGSLLVLDLARGVVQRHDGASGAYLGDFATVSAPSQSFAMTYGPNGNLFVTDISTGGVVEFDGMTGAKLGVFTSGGSPGSPAAVAFGPNGDLYVGDSTTRLIDRYDGTTGSFVGTVADMSIYGSSFIAQMAFGPQGDLYVPVNSAPTVLRLNRNTGALISFMQLAPALNFTYGLAFRPTASDCNGNQVPDDCEDCNSNGLADACDLAAGTSVDLNSNGVPDECEGVDVAVEVVLRDVPSLADLANTLPRPLTTLGNNQTFYAEIWVQDRGATNTGLEAVYVDVAFIPGAVQAVSVTHRPPFTTAVGGVIDNLTGTVMGLGGTDAGATGPGVQPQWARVAVVEFETIICPLELEFALGSALSPIVAVGRGAIAPEDIQFGSAGAQIVPVCVYNLDASNNFIDAADLGVFAGCWLTGPGDAGFDPACDFDCSGFVDAGDLGWFAGAWLKSCSELSDDDYPACRACSEECGGIIGLPCDPGQFCLFPTGQCCCDVPGSCQPIPQSCPPDDEPVCGCDDQTYANECMAWMAGVSVAELEACELPSGPVFAPGVGPTRALANDAPAPTDVKLGWRIEPAGALDAGEPFAVALYVQQTDAAGAGVTAVYVDAAFVNGAARVDGVSHEPVLTAFAAGTPTPRGASAVGGATLSSGVAAGDWVHFATVQATAQRDLARRPRMVLNVSEYGLALRGRGAVDPRRVEMIDLDAGPILQDARE
jgi:subtilisin-like proprotein convertase family protein